MSTKAANLEEVTEMAMALPLLDKVRLIERLAASVLRDLPDQTAKTKRRSPKREPKAKQP